MRRVACRAADQSASPSAIVQRQQYHGGMDSAEFMRNLDIAAEIMRPPEVILQGVFNDQWTFPIEHKPSEISSRANPPRRITVRSDIIPIDEYLGRYDSSTQEITIFSKSIKQAASILKASPFHLTLIVRLHEYAHALLHLGIEQGDHLSVLGKKSEWNERLSRMNAWFNGLDPRLHETLAQLVTREGLRWLKYEATIPEALDAIDRITDLFTELSERQLREYQIDEYEELSTTRLISSIRLLKSGGLVGFDAWKTVVKW